MHLTDHRWTDEEISKMIGIFKIKHKSEWLDIINMEQSTGSIGGESAFKLCNFIRDNYENCNFASVAQAVLKVRKHNRKTLGLS